MVVIFSGVFSGGFSGGFSSVLLVLLLYLYGGREGGENFLGEETPQI